MTVMSIDKWATNGHLIADVASLGYIDPTNPVRDFTYGMGGFWTQLDVPVLIASDILVDKSPIGYSVDFRYPSPDDRYYNTVVLDPPYKLNGTPDPSTDAVYGVDERATLDDRLGLIYDGVQGVAPTVERGGHLLIKVQNQISSGKPIWQTDLVNDALDSLISFTFQKMEEFHFLSYRAQPSGTRQVHARRNSSQLLIYRRTK